jgi:hypothetical protein
MIKVRSCNIHLFRNKISTNLCSVVHRYPLGFPRLAAFQKSDDDWVIFRGFHQSHIRILIQDEVEITRLEQALQAIDTADDANPEMEARLKKTHKETWDPEKENLIQQLRGKLTAYGDAPGLTLVNKAWGEFIADTKNR